MRVATKAFSLNQSAAVWTCLAMLLTSFMSIGLTHACEDGDTLSCKTYDGKAGVKVCVHSKWSGCNAVTNGGNDDDGGSSTTTEPLLCPADRKIVEISGIGDQNERDRQRACFVKSIGMSNTIVRLGPDVDFDFSATHDVTGKIVELFNYPVTLGACVTIEGVAQLTGTVACPETLPGGVVVPPQPTARSHNVTLTKHVKHLPPLLPPLQAPEPARTSRSLGPILRFGNHTGSSIEGATAFLQIGCDAQVNGNGDKIRGFRIYGPTFEDQHDNNYVGVRVANCVAAEIENMEVAGWGGQAIEVNFSALDSIPTGWPSPFWVRVHHNYLHHNLHTSYDGHSAGYGVNTSRNAFSLISQNLLDYNNHDLTSDGNAGGYIAQQNLVLKGGGLHSTGAFGFYMHVFDVHGDNSCTPGGDHNCGNAARFNMLENTFQYKNSDDIGIRGKVRAESFIQHNIFARSSERAAIDLFDDAGIHVDHNSYDVDTFGQYATCDFDGDGVDDLFLATGVTWWFSSAAQFPWTFLRADSNLSDAVALGDFDGDNRCDVLEETPTQKGIWYIARSGKSSLEPLAKDAYGHAADFGHPLNEVRFGRFDPSKRDHRIGVIRSMTHAFWRSPQGEWFITPLDKVDWQYIGGSSFPLSDLKFGDFDGDGVTDVLAVESGHWAYSSAGRKPWKRLNSALGEPVGNLVVLNTDTDDNNDDLLKLELRTLPTDPAHPSPTSLHTTITWWRSRNGSEPWVAWKHDEYTCNPHDPNVALPCGTSYAGHFAAIPGNHVKPVDPKRAGAGVLTIDPWRVGHFYNPGEAVNGRPVEWTNDSAQFRY
ncbi:MAG TPA: VCBS repeat-containing protein [Steroidobacteraceae bacterium]|nr:VCBS repeat-containing protein [Steroidobacteraceae bacterium]